jgi:hypothetical protein
VGVRRENFYCNLELRYNVVTNVTVNVKVTLEQATKAQRGEYRYSSTLSITSALGGVGSQRQAPAALPPRMTRYPLYRRLGGTQGRSGQVRKILPPPGFDPGTLQPIVSSFTDSATSVRVHGFKCRV